MICIQTGRGDLASGKGGKGGSRKAGGGGGASAEVKPEDFINENALGYSVKIPDDIQARIDSGEFGNNAKELFSQVRFSKSEKDAAQKARDEAEKLAGAINYLRNGLPDRPGPKITTQSAFNKALESSFEKFESSSRGLVEIQKIRYDLGNRVSRRDFDNFIFNAPRFAPREGSFAWGTPSPYDRRMLDSPATTMGKLRTYIRRTDD